MNKNIGTTNPPTSAPKQSNATTEVINKMKELLSDNKHKIKLEDYVLDHLKIFITRKETIDSSRKESLDQEIAFTEHLKKYEEAILNLQHIFILLVKWGDENQILLIEKVFQRITDTFEYSAISSIENKLNWYPLQILMYSAGIAALSSENYIALKIILETKISGQTNHNKTLTILTLTGNRMSEINKMFKLIPEYERRLVPRSEYLFKHLNPILEDTLYLGKSYETLFDKFEIISALDYAYLTGGDWAPLGLYCLKNNRIDDPLSPFLEEAKTKKSDWPILKAGFFNSEYTVFESTSRDLKKRIEKLGWY